MARWRGRRRRRAMPESAWGRAAPPPLDPAALGALEAGIAAWWRALSDPGQDGARDRLALRTLAPREGPAAPDLTRALLVPAFRTFAATVRPYMGPPDQGWTVDTGPALTTAAVALAHVSREAEGRVGTALRARKSPLPRPILDEARFRTLIGQTTYGGLLRHVLRALRLLGGESPVGPLGAGLLLWFRDPGFRQAWAADYYGLAEDGAGLPPSSPSARKGAILR